MNLINKIWRHIFRARSWYRLFSHLSSLPQRHIIARKLTEQKARRATQQYDLTPRVAGVLQFFNKKGNITMLWRGIEAAQFDEMIVIDDGSIDGSIRDWVPKLALPNHFLLRSNDLFEIATYDRALNLSRAEIVCLLQDDDRMPANRAWVDRALSLFDEHPDLLILGGFRAMHLIPRDEGPVAEEMVLEIDGNEEHVDGLFRYKLSEFPMTETASGVSDFAFVMSVVRAPVFIRRREFLDLGGFDLDFMPFQCDDVDNSLRAWRAGYKVGLYEVDFVRDLGLGGMRAFNSKRLATQVRINWEKIYRKHGDVINSGELASMVDVANCKLKNNVRS